MILEKTSEFRLHDLPQTKEDYQDGVRFMQSYIRIHHFYHGAMQQAAAQLEILDDEFTSVHHHSPIHHMECRVKSIDSLMEKIHRKGMELNMDSVHKIQDIAGIRVICNYIHDVYYLQRLLTGSNGFRLIRESDYIKNPKPNGYRSLHLIVSVPFMISEGKIELPVEIQLRTIAMDMWASLEHKLRYKSEHQFTEDDLQSLADCAERLASIDQTMQGLFLKASPAATREKRRSNHKQLLLYPFIYKAGIPRFAAYLCQPAVGKRHLYEADPDMAGTQYILHDR